MADDAISLLCSSAKLERDRGVESLNRFIDQTYEGGLVSLENELIRFLIDSESPWETKHGALMGAKAILIHGKATVSTTFEQSIYEYSLNLLEDDEFRVRIAAGEVMGALCRKLGVRIYQNCCQNVIEGIEMNLERQALDIKEEETKKLQEKLVRSQSSDEGNGNSDSSSLSGSSNASQIFHDTAGWKSLETWMKCLQSMIEGCKENFNDFVTEQLLSLIFKTLTHTNRFVRETGYYVCSSLVACNAAEAGKLGERNQILMNGDDFAKHLSQGLADNWSQVRLAASTATRSFLLNLPTDEIRKRFFPVLLPELCLNRYYVAEGVRIYNQETWRLITGQKGKELVEECINPVVEFYISQSEADNHAVREAACACIAELGLKLNTAVVKPFVKRLLDTLLICFKDESWPVRDASCVACGNFVKCFPDESRDSMASLYPLFFENLQDSIASVREGAAIALFNVINAYGREAYDIIVNKVKEGLENVKNQAANVDKYSGIDKGPAVYGVVKKARDNDESLHTNQQMYSCGSLAPKMHRGKRSGGCMNSTFRKPPEPWQMTDGCIHCVAELSKLSEFLPETANLLPNIVKAAGYTHYTQHVVLWETICKRLIDIAKGLGKRLFKPNLEQFFSVLFDSTNCDNALTSNAARNCWLELAKFLGPNILRGRIEACDFKLLEKYDALMI